MRIVVWVSLEVLPVRQRKIRGIFQSFETAERKYDIHLVRRCVLVVRKARAKRALDGIVLSINKTNAYNQ